MLREDGDRQQVSREVVRTTSKVTQHRWSNLVRPVGSHVREKRLVPGGRRLRARSQEKENNWEGSKDWKFYANGATKRTVCGKRKDENEEVDNDVFGVLCISSDAAVPPCLLVSEFPAADVPLTDTGCTCVPCCRQRFVSLCEESFCHASSTRL